MVAPDYAVRPLSECKAGTLVRIAARGSLFLAIVGAKDSRLDASNEVRWIIAIEPFYESAEALSWMSLPANTRVLAIGLKWQLEIDPRSWAKQDGALQTANGSIFACTHGLFIRVHPGENGFHHNPLLFRLDDWTVADNSLRADIYMSNFIATEWSISAYDQNRKCRDDLLKHRVEIGK